MIKRTVQFTVKADGGVIPAIPLFGGVKGEHNATELAVALESDVYENGDTVRLSFTTGDGTVLSSDLIEDIEIADGTATVRYPLPQLLTVPAGQLCVRVVVSKLNEKGQETIRFQSGEMVLYFEHADIENGTPFWTGVSEMLARTVAAKEKAVEAGTIADTAKDKACTAADVASKAADEAKNAKDLAKNEYDKLKNTLEYKGETATRADLESKTGKSVGDVWYIQNERAFYLWDGNAWKLFGGSANGGANGIIPHIGENGNWWIGDEDTGVSARGTSGFYVGTGEMPDDCSFQYDPTDELKYNPDAKTEKMTSPVGVDAEGKLWSIGGSSEWNLIDIFDLSSGAVSYTTDTTEYKKLMIVLPETIDCAAPAFKWKNAQISNSGNGLSKVVGSTFILNDLNDGFISSVSSRSGADTLMESKIYTGADVNNNEFMFYCTSATSGTMRVYGG